MVPHMYDFRFAQTNSTLISTSWVPRDGKILFAPVPIEADCCGVSWDGSIPTQRALSQALHVSGLDLDLKEMGGGRDNLG